MPKLTTHNQDTDAHFCMYCGGDNLHNSSLANKHNVSDGFGFIWSGNPKQAIHIQDQGYFKKIDEIKPPDFLLAAKTPFEAVQMFERACNEWLAIYILEDAAGPSKQ